MTKFQNSELKNVDDVIPSSFKQEAGNKFIDVFRIRHTYIEWMLNKTNICFINLQDFLAGGNPLDLPYQKLDDSVAFAMINYYHANYQNKGGSDGAQATLTCVNYMLKENIIKSSDFEEITDYAFPKETIENNNLKLKVLGL